MPVESTRTTGQLDMRSTGKDAEDPDESEYSPLPGTTQAHCGDRREERGPWKPEEGTKSQRAKVMQLEGVGARFKRRWKRWSRVALLTPVQVDTRAGVGSQQECFIGSEVDRPLECG